MRKNKSKLHLQLVKEGIVDESPVNPRDADSKPAPTATADVVTRPVPKINAAPSPIERAVRKATPTATGLQRAINANIEAQGGHVATAPERTESVTGLQRAINSNIQLQKSKSK